VGDRSEAGGVLRVRTDGPYEGPIRRMPSRSGGLATLRRDRTANGAERSLRSPRHACRQLAGGMAARGGASAAPAIPPQRALQTHSRTPRPIDQACVCSV